jgi:hypothetical protein
MSAVCSCPAHVRDFVGLWFMVVNSLAFQYITPIILALVNLSVMK